LCNGLRILKIGLRYMGVGSGGQGPWRPWIFIHGTDVVNRGFIVLFFGHVLLFRSFFRCSFSPEIFLPNPLLRYSFFHQDTSTRIQRSGDLFNFRVKLPHVSTIYPLIVRGNPGKCLAQRHNK